MRTLQQKADELFESLEWMYSDIFTDRKIKAPSARYSIRVSPKINSRGLVEIHMAKFAMLPQYHDEELAIHTISICDVSEMYPFRLRLKRNPDFDDYALDMFLLDEFGIEYVVQTTDRKRYVDDATLFAGNMDEENRIHSNFQTAGNFEEKVLDRVMKRAMKYLPPENESYLSAYSS
ncbi:TPA: hypothetical protein HA239_04605 [Candidatus Woesearchaeota archaeon]|nr:hypothetical protein QT06_C0001G0116 [archaeon GW2011_AR15]MBS3104079.1 hypothetical protein [Candidatus Woesearchaeota archaeon]HIH41671.1 hypothetical protein [Candidatus Woesearchaeota archaeon]